MKVDVVDMTDPVLSGSVLGFISRYTDQVIRMYPQSNSFTKMAMDVASAAGSSGVIEILRIWGHGGDGVQALSAGTSGANVIDDQAGLFWIVGAGNVIRENVHANAGALRQLGDLITPEGHVEFKGCSVASGVNGREMLKTIAKILDRPVQAGTVYQYSAVMAEDGVGWTGTIVEEDPNGLETFFQGTASP